MDIWETFNETELPPKISFYSELNLEDITNKDQNHAQKVRDTFNIENLGNYHDLYIQSDTLKCADVFQKFREKCIEIYQQDPAHFVSAPGLVRQACLKKTNIKLTDKKILLTFEEVVRGGICQSIVKYTCANKDMKNYNKKMPSSYSMYLDANNLYGWAMCKKLLLGKFEWIHPEDYTENHIKSYTDSDEYGAILEVDIEYPEELLNKHKTLTFLPERRKINKTNKLITTIEDE